MKELESTIESIEGLRADKLRTVNKYIEAIDRLVEDYDEELHDLLIQGLDILIDNYYPSEKGLLRGCLGHLERSKLCTVKPLELEQYRLAKRSLEILRDRLLERKKEI